MARSVGRRSGAFAGLLPSAAQSRGERLLVGLGFSTVPVSVPATEVAAAEIQVLQQRLAWQLEITLGLAVGLSLAGAGLVLWVALPQSFPRFWLAAVPLAPLLVLLVIWSRRVRLRRREMRFQQRHPVRPDPGRGHSPRDP